MGEYSRWWVKDGIFVYDGELGAAYIRLSRIVISERYEVKEVAIEKPEEFKDYKRGGHLIDRELPVVRHKDRYLRVGYSIAWHRVLGLLDDGRWVLIGDGLYEAEFVPTAKNPLEDFGEVGYVKVLGPYAGSLDDVQSPCGAPRLVACTEEGRAVVGALLDYVRGCWPGGGCLCGSLRPSLLDLPATLCHPRARGVGHPQRGGGGVAFDKSLSFSFEICRGRPLGVNNAFHMPLLLGLRAYPGGLGHFPAASL